MRDTCAELQIPPLAAYGQEHLPILVEKAAGGSSMKANPIVLTGEELRQFLVRAT